MICKRNWYSEVDLNVDEGTTQISGITKRVHQLIDIREHYRNSRFKKCSSDNASTVDIRPAMIAIDEDAKGTDMISFGLVDLWDVKDIRRLRDCGEWVHDDRRWCAGALSKRMSKVGTGSLRIRVKALRLYILQGKSTAVIPFRKEPRRQKIWLNSVLGLEVDLPSPQVNIVIVSPNVGRR